MLKMQSERPLYVNREAVTEFETDEQHARELEARGLAQRVPAEQAEQAAPPPAGGEEQPAAPPTEDVTQEEAQAVAAASPRRHRRSGQGGDER